MAESAPGTILDRFSMSKNGIYMLTAHFGVQLAHEKGFGQYIYTYIYINGVTYDTWEIRGSLGLVTCLFMLRFRTKLTPKYLGSIYIPFKHTPDGSRWVPVASSTIYLLKMQHFVGDFFFLYGARIYDIPVVVLF